MQTTDQFKLVDGTYSAKDAEEILMSLIADKIRFHQANIFSCTERNSGDTAHSKQRIEELKAEKVRVRTLLRDLRKGNCKIKVESQVNITVEENVAVV